MTEVKYWRAVNRALDDAMAADDRVLIIGQDVGAPGGPYGLTRRLLDAYGPERVRDAPISEAAIVAAGVGAAVSGLRPVVDLMFLDFIGLGLDQIINQAVKYPFFTEGRLQVPMVITTLYGGRANMGAQHSQSLEAWLCHTPGLKVAFPSDPVDAYGVMRAAIDDPNPVVVINSISLLKTTGEFPTGDPPVTEPGTGRLVQTGKRCTVVSYGPALKQCQDALADMDVDLIDLRWLSPWPRTLVLDSVRRTSRLLVVHDAITAGGWGAEIAATVAYDAFWHLDAPAKRLGATPRPLPVAETGWKPLLPSTERIKTAVEQLVTA